MDGVFFVFLIHIGQQQTESKLSFVTNILSLPHSDRIKPHCPTMKQL